FIGHCDELDAQPANLPVRVTQLRQIESSGRSPVAPVVMHQQGAGAQQATQGDVVAVLVAKLEIGSFLAEHRLAVLERGWSWEPCTDCAQLNLHPTSVNTRPCCTIWAFAATSGILG